MTYGLGWNVAAGALDGKRVWHTGNTAGYTQLIAANADGTRSTVVSINSQITPKANAKRFGELREIYTLAVCAALA